MDCLILMTFFPKKPTDVEVKVMKEMFEASVDGEAYDMDRFGQYFRPAGMAARTGDPVKANRPKGGYCPKSRKLQLPETRSRNSQ